MISNGRTSKNIRKEKEDGFELVLSLSDWKKTENQTITGTFEETQNGNHDETEEMDFEMIDGVMRETRPHQFKIPSMSNPPLPQNK